MYKVLLFAISAVLILSVQGEIFNFEKLDNYTRLLGFSANDPGNELWKGIIKDCSKKVSFSCIQKNAYSYLDRTLIDRDNITVFDGFRLSRNNLDYDACVKRDEDNLVEGNDSRKLTDEDNEIKDDEPVDQQQDEEEEEEELSPLEEVTHALRKKALRFLATRDYQIRLPESIGQGAGIKISPREIDDKGALVRIDWDTSEIERRREESPNGRLFFVIKKIKKQIQNKLFTAFLLLILLIKIIKLKFMFVIPFLFGVGTAKKLFLKLLLFLVPAFAHVFKLCSSYYSTHATRFHQHHHHKVKVAHHHHHIAVPVPVVKPVYYDSPKPTFDHPPPSFHSSGPPSGPPPSFHSSGPPSGPPTLSHPPPGANIVLDEDFQGYDYAHPHIQYRKDIEELKEWGIEPYEDQPYDQIVGQEAGVIHPGPPLPPLPAPPKLGPPKFPPPFAKPPLGPPPGFVDKIRPPPPPHAQSLAYAGYGPFPPPGLPPNTGPNRQATSASSALPIGVVAAPDFGISPKQKTGAQSNQQPNLGAQQNKQQSQQPRPVYHQRNDVQPQAPAAAVGGGAGAPGPAVAVVVPAVTAAPAAATGSSRYDDGFFGPILGRLDEIFAHLRFTEEKCRERLVCSMYKHPELYAPHSNLVSNELSRDPQELQQGNSASAASQRFHQYLAAARLGQDGGDCLKSFPCPINTEQ